MVGAQRVNKMTFEDNETFDLADSDHWDWLVDHANVNTQLNRDGEGIFLISVGDLKLALKAGILDPEGRKRVRSDIKWAIKNKRDTVMYRCW